MNLSVVLLRAGAILAIALCIGRLAYGFASAASRTAETVGLRGLKRQRAISENELWARVEPLVRWLGGRLRGLLPEGLRASFERQLALAGSYLGLLPEELFALSLLSGMGCVVVGAAIGLMADGGMIIAILLGTIGPFLPWIVLVDAAGDRLAAISRDVPHVIDVMQLSVSAGLDFPAAIRQIIEKNGRPREPINEELGLIIQSLSLGRTRRAALEEFAERVPVAAVREFSNVIIQAEQQGSSLEIALGILSGVARQGRTAAAEERASKAGIAMVAPLGLMFLSVMLLVVAPMLLGLGGSLE